MDQSLKGWFTERSPMWPGQAFSLKVKELLLEKKTKYQDLKIFESTHYGRVLVLDGAIQCTERDESSYQEMISFLPLNSHPCPTKVLVIGGGDGGVVREVTKHPKVKKIVQCEIDEEVIDATKKHIPSMGCGFSSPKLTLVTDDGADFLDKTQEKFDVIITDASDPVVADDSIDDGTKNGPAATLFNEDYYQMMKEKLTDKGILCCQGENMWLHSKLIADLLTKCRQIYPVVEYAYTCTPTYPGGQIGFILCSKNPDTKFQDPLTTWTDDECDEFSLKYYTSDMHKSSLVLPGFMKKIISKCH